MKRVLCVIFTLVLAMSLTACATGASAGSPTQSGESQSPYVSFVSVQGAPAGGTAEVFVQTTPNASCSIQYLTPHGTPSQAGGLVSKMADSNGRVGWSWVIGTDTIPGTGWVTVSCNGASATTPIQVG